MDGFLIPGGVVSPNKQRKLIRHCKKDAHDCLDACGSFLDGKGWGLAIDIGAHAGGWTYWLSRKFKRVIAIEPVPEMCACLRVNVPTAQTIEAAACDQNGPMRFWVHTNHLMGCNPPRDGEPSHKIDVHGLAIDSLHQTPSFVKIDADGMDLRVLNGMRETIREASPAIYVETKYHATEIRDFLKYIRYYLVGSFGHINELWLPREEEVTILLPKLPKGKEISLEPWAPAV